MTNQPTHDYSTPSAKAEVGEALRNVGSRFNRDKWPVMGATLLAMLAGAVILGIATAAIGLKGMWGIDPELFTNPVAFADPEAAEAAAGSSSIASTIVLSVVSALAYALVYRSAVKRDPSSTGAGVAHIFANTLGFTLISFLLSMLQDAGLGMAIVGSLLILVFGVVTFFVPAGIAHGLNVVAAITESFGLVKNNIVFTLLAIGITFLAGLAVLATCGLALVPVWAFVTIFTLEARREVVRASLNQH